MVTSSQVLAEGSETAGRPIRSFLSASGAQCVVLAALIAFVSIALCGSVLGWGTDRDSIRVVQAAQSILAGHYVRSRSWGFPLHEAASAVLLAAGGVVAVNTGTVLACTGGIVIGLRVAHHLAPGRVALAAVTLAGAPLLLGCASAAIDFGWDFAAAMALLLVALHLTRRPEAGECVQFGAAVLALLLLRPDNVLFAAAVTLALVWKDGPGRTILVAVAVYAALSAMAIYVCLNGLAVLAGGVSTTRSLAERLPRAMALGSAAIGPGGALALVLLARLQGGAHQPASLLARIVWIAWLLYVPRFVLLPDQAEYLILPVLTTLLLAACTLQWRAALICTAVNCMPALVTVSFFARSPPDGVLRFSPALQPGTVAQDWAARRFAAEMERPAMASTVASRLRGPLAPARLRYETFLPAYVSFEHDLVIGEMHLSRVTSATVRTAYRTVWACDAPLGPGIGWRGWEAPVMDTSRVLGALNCWPSEPGVPVKK